MTNQALTDIAQAGKTRGGVWRGMLRIRPGLREELRQLKDGGFWTESSFEAMGCASSGCQVDGSPIWFALRLTPMGRGAVMGIRKSARRAA